ncbi:11352_t:CDS:1, partial [Acaulospora colombiana]
DFIPISGAPGIPPPPFGFPQAPGGFPTPPLGFPALNMPHPTAFENLPPGAIPPPPFGFPNFPPNLHQQQQQPPPLPRGFREAAGPAGHIDPLHIPGVSAAQPFQAYQQQQQRRTGPTLPSNPSLPKRPPPPTSTKLALDENSAAATISAAPELRDFRKEATSFVPRGIRQKAQPKENPRVNAAPGDTADAEMEEVDAPPNLMEALKKAGVAANPPAASKTSGEAGLSASKDRNQEQKDEYD